MPLSKKKNNELKEKIRKRYEDMKRALDEDLRTTLTQLDTEHEATEQFLKGRIEACYHLTQELDQELSNTGADFKPFQVNTRRLKHLISLFD